MTRNSALLKVQPDIIVNIDNVAYIELTGKGGADIHFAGRVKPLHLKATEAESLRDFISGQQVTDISSTTGDAAVDIRSGSRIARQKLASK